MLHIKNLDKILNIKLKDGWGIGKVLRVGDIYTFFLTYDDKITNYSADLCRVSQKDNDLFGIDLMKITPITQHTNKHDIVYSSFVSKNTIQDMEKFLFTLNLFVSTIHLNDLADEMKDIQVHSNFMKKYPTLW